MLTSGRRLLVIEKPSLSMVVITILFVILMRGSASSIELYLKVGLTFLWILITFLENRTAASFTFSSKLSVCVYMYIIVKLMFNLAICNNIAEPINSALVSISFYIGIFVVQYYYLLKRNLSQLIAWIGCIYAFYCIKAIIFYIQNPGAGRVFSEYRDNVAVGNGYGIAFGCAVAAAYFVGLMKIQQNSEKGIKKQLAYMVLVVLSVLVCFFVQSSITIYAMIIGMAFNLIFASKDRISMSQFAIFIMVIAVIIVIYCNLDYIARFALNLCDNVENNAMIDRIEVLANYQLYGTQSVAITGRQQVYIQSIQSFFEHPILGASVNTSYYDLRLIGDHSSFLDDFGHYGIMVGVLNVMVFVKPFLRHYFSRLSKAYGALITLCIVAIFDPITQSTATGIIFLFIGLVEIFQIEKIEEAMEVQPSE